MRIIYRLCFNNFGINNNSIISQHFFLAGNPNPRGQSGSRYEEEIRGRREQEQGEQQQQRRQTGNLFDGFDQNLLADVFNVDPELVRNLQGREDQRGRIIRVERFDVLSPEFEEREEQRPSREREGRGGSQPNGLEETICTMRLGENLGRPSRADVYNPRGGRISTLNSHKLPILNWLQLSAERGVLYQASQFFFTKILLAVRPIRHTSSGSSH